MAVHEPPVASEDAGRRHDRDLVREVLSMTPRERLEELTVVESFFEGARRLG